MRRTKTWAMTVAKLWTRIEEREKRVLEFLILLQPFPSAPDFT